MSLSGCTLKLQESIPLAEGAISTATPEDEENDPDVTAQQQSTPKAPDNTKGSSSASTPSVNAGVQEQAVVLLPLPEILDSANLEISAMDWFGDHLILVPQFPEAYDNQVFAIARQQIIEAIDGSRTDPLDVLTIPINSGLLRLRIPRFYGGFEAIAFTENRVYLTVEAGNSQDMAGYVVGGDLVADDSPTGLKEIVLDYENITEIEGAASLGNVSEEAIVAYNDGVITMYEANGVNVNPSPVAHWLEADLSIQARLPLPNIEYRITDATRVDENGRFWAINYLFPGDIEKLDPIHPEPLAALFGQGATHKELETVERLVEFQVNADGITLTDRPPIQLELFGGNVEVLGRALGDEIPRNWEGIARLESRGFLLATDKFPDTILGFVPFP